MTIEEVVAKQRDEWLDLPESGTSFDVSGGTCSAVIGVGADGARPSLIRVERPSAIVEGDGGQIWCSCGDERVVVRPAPGTEGHVAARLSGDKPSGEEYFIAQVPFASTEDLEEFAKSALQDI